MGCKHHLSFYPALWKEKPKLLDISTEQKEKREQAKLLIVDYKLLIDIMDNHEINAETDC